MLFLEKLQPLVGQPPKVANFDQTLLLSFHQPAADLIIMPMMKFST